MGEWLRVNVDDPWVAENIVPAVWEMVQATYRPIGLIVNSPDELREYDVWDVFGDPQGVSAFRLSKTTPFGIKGGLVGSDGSRSGKDAVKAYVSDWYFEPGHYSEVSHRMAELAQRVGAPVVCATYVPQVLNKAVTPEPDGIHYRRAIKNVGEVVKIMVGRPRDVPTTAGSAPKCPVPALGRLGRGASVDSSTIAALDHAATLIDL